MSKNNKKWHLIINSTQIADTGDYDGNYQITNGDISLFTNDDVNDNELLDNIVDSLNKCECKFYLDDSIEFENYILKKEIKELKDLLHKHNISTTDEYDVDSDLNEF